MILTDHERHLRTLLAQVLLDPGQHVRQAAHILFGPEDGPSPRTWHIYATESEIEARCTAFRTHHKNPEAYAAAVHALDVELRRRWHAEAPLTTFKHPIGGRMRWP